MAGEDARQPAFAPPLLDGEADDVPENNKNHLLSHVRGIPPNPNPNPNPNLGVNNGTNYYAESSSKSVEIYDSTTDGLLTLKSEDLESPSQLQSFLNQLNLTLSRKGMKMTVTALPDEELDSPSSYPCPGSPTLPGKMKRVDAREARLQKLEDAHIRRNQKGNTDEEDEDTSDSSDSGSLSSPSSLSSHDSSVDELSVDSWPSDSVTLDWKNELELMPDDDVKEWRDAFPNNTGHWLRVRRVLYEQGLRLRPKWLASVPNIPGVLGSPQHIAETYWVFMDTDISKSSKPILPSGGAPAFWNSEVEHVNFFMLQIEEVVDISEQIEKWFPDEFLREREYRLLSLTDGVERVEGFEYEPLGDNIEWGSKVALHQTTIVGYEGLLKLVEETCQLKGFPEKGNDFKVSTQLADKVKDGGAFLNRVKKSYELWRRDSSNGPGQISNGKAPSG